MSKPLFEIGEEVILQSKSFPEYNGEYKITLAIKPKTAYVDVNGKNCYNNGENFSYTLDEVLLNERGREICWEQSALRKKHKPSEFGSYEALMNNLKIKEKA